ncbi:MAG: aspartate racemase [Chlamydiales bacterium]|jgi:aspartate racemase
MTNDKVIGIVGGVGPQAGIDLHSKIIKHTNSGGTDQGHLRVCHLSFADLIADRTEFLAKPNYLENPAEGVNFVMNRLHEIGVEIVGIPCNTMHVPSILDPIKKLAGNYEIEFVDMVEEVVSYLDEFMPGIKRIGVLSTQGTYDSQMYPNKLSAKGYSVLVPDKKIQVGCVQDAIYNREYGIKACSSEIDPRAHSRIMRGFKDLQIKGAQAVILACSEIPLVIREDMVDGVHIIDSTDILAKALVRAANPEKLLVKVKSY